MGALIGLLVTVHLRSPVIVESDFPVAELEARNALFKSFLDEQSYFQSRIVSLREQIEDVQEEVALQSEENNIEYIKEKVFKDCKSNSRNLFFDFYLPRQNICIEYDGKQHFEPFYLWGEKAFEITKRTDKIKNKYCEDNNIKLLRIPYWKIPEVELERNLKLFSG